MDSKFFKKWPIITQFIKAKFLSQKIPIFIGWDLTYRCNFNCQYCRLPEFNPVVELSTEKVFSIIKQLKLLGTKRIQYGGGEVLLRNDIGKIIHFCKANGIHCAVLTNGALFRDRLDDIKNIDLVKISFDGPKKIHDALRQQGAFDKVMEAVELAKQHNIKIAFNTTLTSYNLEHINFILNISKKFRVPVVFQMVNSYLAGEKDISKIKISQDDSKVVFRKLLQAKKNNPYIVNSELALKYLHDYPNVREFSCGAGKIYARISAEGRFYPCTLFMCDYTKHSKLESNMYKSFNSLPNVNCKNCLCPMILELNYIYNLNIKAIWNALWRL